MPTCENVLLHEKNNGGYGLAIVAKFEEPFPVSYIIRVTTPQGVQADFVSTLDGFKNIGDLLIALHYFAGTKLYSARETLVNEELSYLLFT